MEIMRAGSRPSRRAPEAYFAGVVRQDPVIEAPAPSAVRAVVVTFEAGARTAWHSHPLGQTLVVLSGLGRARSEGGAVRELRPGDVVWFAPGERHWHGAGPETAMSHLAIQEALDGVSVDWQEQVAEADYCEAAEG